MGIFCLLTASKAKFFFSDILVFSYYLRKNSCYALSLSDLLPTFYAVCPSGGCSNDMQIITNNFVYDNISNIINIEAGFYLPMNSRNEHLEYIVPIWTHRTTDNFTNYYYPNASGFIFLPNFGTLYLLFHF